VKFFLILLSLLFSLFIDNRLSSCSLYCVVKPQIKIMGTCTGCDDRCVKGKCLYDKDNNAVTCTECSSDNYAGEVTVKDGKCKC